MKIYHVSVRFGKGQGGADFDEKADSAFTAIKKAIKAHPIFFTPTLYENAIAGTVEKVIVKSDDGESLEWLTTEVLLNPAHYRPDEPIKPYAGNDYNER